MGLGLAASCSTVCATPAQPVNAESSASRVLSLDGPFPSSTLKRIDGKYLVSGKVGVGASSVVRKAKRKTGADGQAYAVKAVLKTGARSSSFASEVRILKACAHPNVVALAEACEDERCFYAIVELCAGKDVLQTLSSTVFTEKSLASVGDQMLAAVGCLHEVGVAHCDLRPESFHFVDPPSKINLRKEYSPRLKLLGAGRSLPTRGIGGLVC